jgi:hypothetical protein
VTARESIREPRHPSRLLKKKNMAAPFGSARQRRPTPGWGEASLAAQWLLAAQWWTLVRERERPVTVEAITTRTAAVRIETIHRVQSTPGEPLPPKAS